MTKYKNKLYHDLKELGVKEGDVLMVHSSLRSVGSFINKPQIIVEVLKKVLGPSGTLLMPALTYENVGPSQPVFDEKQTPSCVGALTEYFRELPDTLRSIHPTHSVCAVGENSRALLDKHYLDNTPCGPNSPFTKLKENNGKILFMGCGLQPNTLMHGIEELIQPEYLFDNTTEYTIITNSKSIYKKKYINHGFKGFKQRYDRILDVLEKEDYSSGKILQANSYLIPSEIIWEKVYKKLRMDSLYFIDRNSTNR